jgi:hypothetical protein
VEVSVTLLLALACANPKVDTPVRTVEVCDACGGTCQLDGTDAPSRNHTTADLDYTLSPPMGGDHHPCWAEWGVHTEELAPENWVHNLEHGGVVFLYAPAVPATDVATLTSFVETRPGGRAILSPWSAPMDLPGATVAAVAWARRLQLACVDLDALGAFYDTWLGRGPEDTMMDPPSICTDTADTGTGDTGAGAR